MDLLSNIKIIVKPLTMKKSILIFVVGLLGWTLHSQAQTTTRRVTKTQVKQKARIKQGQVSGQLTRYETAGLKAQQRHINRSKHRAKADGVVTRKERAGLKKQQKKANRSIFRQKHDDQSQN